MVTRAIAVYVDMASFVVNELKQVGIEATLKQIETAQWHPMATRGEYQIGANLTGLGIDDPDANFYENYALRLAAELQRLLQRAGRWRMIDQQSQELDPKKRLAMVQRDPEEARGGRGAADPGWRLDYFALWPHVKNLVPHTTIYNFGRMQDVWLDK